MRLRQVGAGLLVLSIVGALSGAAAAAPTTPTQRDAAAQVLVRFAHPADAAPALAAAGATDNGAIGAGYSVVRVPTGRTRAQLLAALREQPGVVSAQPDALVSAQGAPPNDPGFPQQWALRNTGQSPHGVPATPGVDVDALTAWDAVAPPQLSPITVAVVDTGVRADHPDLAGAVLPGQSFVTGVSSADDDNGHGTQVAGIIAAATNDGGGIAGLARGVKILPVKVLDRTGQGSIGAVVDGMNWATGHGARVVDLSLALHGAVPDAFYDAVASHPDVLFVLAAGNFGDDSIDRSPSSLCATPRTNLLCVTATDEADRVPKWASTGAPAVALGAPGVDVVSDDLHTTTTPIDLDHASAWTLGAGWSVGGGHLRYSNHGTVPDPGYGTSLNAALISAVPVPAAQVCHVDYDVHAALAAIGDGATLGYATPSTGIRGNWYANPTFDGGVQDDVTDPDAAAQPTWSVRLQASVAGDPSGAAVGDVDITNMRLVCGDAGQAPRASDLQELSGTSASAPFTAATAALVLGATPSARPEDLAAKIECGVDPVSGLGGQATATGGRLDAAGALAAQLGARPATPVGRVTTLAGAVAPRVVAAAPDGSIVYTSHDDGQAQAAGWSLHRLRPDGSDQVVYRPADDERATISGLAVSPSDRSIWFVKSDDKLERMDPQGTIHDVLTLSSDDHVFAATMYADPDGSLYIAHADPAQAPHFWYQAVERIDRAGRETPVAAGFPYIQTITRDEHGALLVGSRHTSYEVPPADGIYWSQIDRVASDGTTSTVLRAPVGTQTGPIGAADGHFWADVSPFVWVGGRAILLDTNRMWSIAPGGILAPFAGTGGRRWYYTEPTRPEGTLAPDWRFRASSDGPSQVAVQTDGSIVVKDLDQLERIGTEHAAYPLPFAPCAGSAAIGGGGAAPPSTPSTPTPTPAGAGGVAGAGTAQPSAATAKRRAVLLKLSTRLTRLRGGALRLVLRVTGTPGAHVTITCAGGRRRGCASRLPHATLATHGAKSLTVTGLRPGATLTIRAAASGRVARYARVRITATRRLGRTTTGCLDARGHAARCPASGPR